MIDGRKMNKTVIENIPVYLDKELNDININSIKEEIAYHIVENNRKPEKIYVLHYLKYLASEFKNINFKTTMILTN